MIDKKKLKSDILYDLEETIGKAEDIDKKYFSDDFDGFADTMEKAMKMYIKRLRRELNKLK